MKKEKNDTWLGFFKKTLKVTGFIIVALILVVVAIIGWVIYNERNAERIGTIYLKCENNLLAFDDRKIYSNWDGLEKNWEVSLDITEKNKRIVEAKFKFDGGEGLYTIDRINGTIELKNLTKNEILTKKNCIKIKKSDLPESKETPKF
ncbi:hypothetical protein [Candidatus Pelagibacter sp.]|uniref:hypothetical protein n=1 Tax=Candidatus Pelagibacter sp. TaxID=2024849 RepID=UPI003F853296